MNYIYDVVLVDKIMKKLYNQITLIATIIVF